MIAGRATPEGTARYAERFPAAAGHVRTLSGGDGPAALLSSLGLGTYLGREDLATDSLYRRAVGAVLERGVNVIDTAVNYRHQRSERAIGAALADLVGHGALRRDEVLVATKGGYIPFDSEIPRDPGAYVTETYLRPGLIESGEVVAGSHCMAPRYLEDQIARSRTNLGLETIDVYYVHNPETQLEEVEGDEFMRRVGEAFSLLEAQVVSGRIARYGVATWSGFREPLGAPGHLSLPDLVEAARAAGGPGHHFKVIQLPYNLAMTEAFTRANQRVGQEVVSTLEAARRLGVYVMASASVYQGQLARNLPAVIADFLPGLASDAQRAIQFVRSTPGIGTALVGMKSLAHVEENAGVANVPPIPWEEFQGLFTRA